MQTFLLILVAAAALFGAKTVMSADNHETGEARGWSHGGAQGRGSRDPARMIERMTKHLDLDETQQQTVSNIIEAARPEFESLRERASVNRTAMRELVTTDPDYSAKLSNLAVENGELMAEGTILFGRVRAELSAELTDEQRATLEARMAKGRERGRRGGRRNAKQGETAQ
jgi:Spy/CpxP family protein refolding chaperone